MRNLLLVTAAELLLGGLLWAVDAARVKDRIYVGLEGAKFCFKRTNGTHEFGCTSSMNGNVGVAALVTEPPDLDWLLNEAENKPYIALLSPLMFNFKNLNRLRNSDKITGIILLKATEADPRLKPLEGGYSDDQTCPNSMSSLYRDTPSACDPDESPWNVAAESILYQKWNFPIFLIEDVNVTRNLLSNCHDKFNDRKPGSDWPYCAVELRAHMYTAVDTTTCIRRSTMINNLNPTPVCDPMGDTNILYFRSPRNSGESEPEKSVILVTTKLDTVTLFDGTELGPVTPITGIVTLLTVASLISERQINYDEGISNILFAFFNGEAFDYIGSSRMVYDMGQGEFPNILKSEDEFEKEAEKNYQLPLRLSHLKMGLELDQLSSVDDDGKIFSHQNGNSNVLSDMVESLRDLAEKYGVDFSKSSRKTLPPSSLQSFLKANDSLPALSLSNFDDRFVDPYFHSVYENAQTLRYHYEDGEEQSLVQKLASVSEITAEFLYRMATNTVPRRKFRADKKLINEILHCYVDTAQCGLFKASLTKELHAGVLTKAPFPQYVGVRRSRIPHGSMTYRLLSLLTGTPTKNDSTSCETPKDQNIFNYFFLKGREPPPGYNGTYEECLEDPDCGTCYRTTTTITPAVSPAFKIENYDFSDPTYASWAESVWKITSARIFLKASPALDDQHFAIGLVIFIFSFCIIWFLDRNAGILFSPVSSAASSAIATEEFSEGEPL